jgi:hypothetical protein
MRRPEITNPMTKELTMNTRILIIVGTLTVITVAAPAQPTPPSTDIWLAPLRARGTTLGVGTPVNVTNRAGYDNQPSFLTDGSGILYTALQDDPPGPQAPTQTDIFRYIIATKSTERVTKTAESEYSPTLMPSGSSFSVVRVEPDSTQRLWRFDLNGLHPSLLLPHVKPVGYHAWIDERTVALFVLGSPPMLLSADVITGVVDTIIGSIGRSLHKIPGRRAVSFVHKVSPGEWWIKEFDLAAKSITAIVRTLAGREDYAWTPDGILVMAQGSKLFSYRPGASAGWTEIADFSSQKIEGVTRIAVSPLGNWIAFVATE